MFCLRIQLELTRRFIIAAPTAVATAAAPTMYTSSDIVRVGVCPPEFEESPPLPPEPDELFPPSSSKDSEVLVALTVLDPEPLHCESLFAWGNLQLGQPQ